MSNIYRPVGQCTWYCAEVDPWCMRYGNLGNALDWAANWRSRGGWVQMTPMVGTIACFQPGSNAADAVFGHVAVVIEVTGNLFRVSEMNGPSGPGHTDDRGCTNNPGVSYLVETTPSEEPDVLYLFTARDAQGGLADCLSANLLTWRWIQTPQQLADIEGLAAAAGQKIVMHTPGVPVADIGAFGVPQDATSAAKFGVTFP